MRTKTLVQQLAGAETVPEREQRREDLSRYRRYTVGMLHRYFRISLETGKLPSVLGQQFFRARVTSYRMTSFEEAVIFVRDIEACLTRLDDFSRKLVAHCVLEGYRQEEVSRMLNCPLRSIERHFSFALDELTRLFLDRGILRNFSCQ